MKLFKLAALFVIILTFFLIFNQRPKDYYPILATGGRSFEDLDDFPASQLRIPHELLRSKGKDAANGRMHLSLSVAVMLPDFEPAKSWKERNKKALREKFKDELKFGRIPKKKKMSEGFRIAYQAISDDYNQRLLVIGLSSARDIYSVTWRYEGYPSVQEQERLKEQGVYHGPIYDGDYAKLDKTSRNGVPITFKVGKYGEGLWPYKDGLGHEFIQEEINATNALWEYANYEPVGDTVPRVFLYTPVEAEKPHQLYFQCWWNGNVDYLAGSGCKAESIFDETIRYSFTIKRRRLDEYKEVNRKVKELIQSFVVEKGMFSELTNNRNRH